MSRCQIFDFKPVSVEDIVQNLKNILGKENISYEEEALFLIAEKADGAMRDALSFTDSVLNFSPECISREAAYKVLNVVDTQKYFDLVSCLLEKDIFNTILQCNEILAEGYDVINLAYGLLNFFRNLLLSKAPSTVNFIAGPDNVVLMLKNFGKKIEVDNILTCISEINLWSLNYKDQINKKFSFEFLLFRLKKNIYCERAIIQNTSVGETFVEKNEIKKTFDLNCLNVGEGFSESEEDSQKKRSLLDVFEKEIALTNI
jgi:DNA polymerase-3 subunit gamma/tau